MLYAKDQYALTSKALIQLGFSRVQTAESSTPRCVGELEFNPDVQGGCSYLNERLAGARNEATFNIAFPVVVDNGIFKGSHAFTLGADAEFLGFSERQDQTGFAYYRQDGTTSSEVLFGGHARIHHDNGEQALFAQDIWLPKNWIAAGLGVRYDYNAFLGGGAVTPRLNISVEPPLLGGRTKFTGGYALASESLGLYMFTRPEGQYAFTTDFAPNGITPIYQDAEFYTVDPSRIRMPVARVASAGVEQILPGNIRIGANFTTRFSPDSFGYDTVADDSFVPPVTLPPSSEMTRVLYELGNVRWVRYQEMEVYVKKELSFKQCNAKVTGSYAKTTATSDVPVDYSDIPPVRDQGSASSVLSYDMPNRLVSDGILRTPLWVTSP